MSGGVTPDDLWTLGLDVIAEEADVRAMEVQGLKRLVVRDARAVRSDLLPVMAQRGLQVVAPGAGSCSSFVAMLPQLLV